MTSFNIVISHRPNQNVSHLSTTVLLHVCLRINRSPYVYMYVLADGCSSMSRIESLSAFFPSNTVAAEWDVLGSSFKNVRIGQLRSASCHHMFTSTITAQALSIHTGSGYPTMPCICLV